MHELDSRFWDDENGTKWIFYETIKVASMRIDVHLLGTLAQYSPTGEEKFKMELSGEAAVAQLLEAIKFPTAMERMILVNGVQAHLSTRLADGDEVFIFGPAAGG